MAMRSASSGLARVLAMYGTTAASSTDTESTWEERGERGEGRGERGEERGERREGERGERGEGERREGG